MVSQQICICKLPAVYSNSFPGVSQKIYRQRRREELRHCEEKLIKSYEQRALQSERRGWGRDVCNRWEDFGDRSETWWYSLLKRFGSIEGNGKLRMFGNSGNTRDYCQKSGKRDKGRTPIIFIRSITHRAASTCCRVCSVISISASSSRVPSFLNIRQIMA